MGWQSRGIWIIIPLAPLVLKKRSTFDTMAAKKTAKKTTESTPTTEPAPKPAAKKAAKPTTAKKSAEEKSPAAPKKAAAKKVAAPAAKKVPAKPSLDAVARAAYLNYRRRVEQGLPGDSHGDWLEAERQFNEPG